MIIKRTRYFSSKDDKKKRRNALIAGAGLTAGTALAIGLAIRNKNKKAAQKAIEEEVIKKSEAERQRITKEAEEYVKSREAQTERDVNKLNELREDLQKVYRGEKPVEDVAEKAKKLRQDVENSLEGIEKETDYEKISSKLKDTAERLGIKVGDYKPGQKWDL